MKRHGRDNYYVVGEGILTSDGKTRSVCLRASTEADLRKFRFSRLGPKGTALDDATLETLAGLMTAKAVAQPDSTAPPIPAGFTYLGQFVDHDMTFDNTTNVPFGQPVNVQDLVQGRSPALDLDSLYGRGPGDPADGKLYTAGARLRMGRTAATTFGMPNTNVDRDGFDLPRAGSPGGSKPSERRRALIPDHRNDENLAVAQTHLAFMRFHNRVVDTLAEEGTPTAELFRAAQAVVVKHYQWMLRTDFLPRIVDPAIVDDVFRNGRRFFELVDDPSGREKDPSLRYLQPGDTPTMPIEFSVAAYRLGHSMIRGGYQWNRVFRDGGASLMKLFTFSGTSGTLSPDGDESLQDVETGTFERLPTNWIADFRRLVDFSPFNQPDLVVPPGEFNVAKRIDTLLVNPLDQLPPGSFGRGATAPIQANLAFRNLVRATMVQLATGQQMAHMFAKKIEIKPLSVADILQGNGGVDLTGLPQEQKDSIVADTPLWFYILREAERDNGRLTGVGARIVAEVFHRAMEGSRHSIVRDPTWRPRFGRGKTFEMIDLLMFAFEGNVELLNPLG